MGPIYAGIFLVAASVILLQIALTRVFAIMMWHHLTYMVISIAMLGFGAAGSLLTATGEGTSERPPEPRLAAFSTAFGLAVIVAFFLATSLPLDTLGLVDDPLGLARLGLLYLILAVPFLFGGLTIGLALARFAHAVSRVYFFDLIGSAAGGAASVWLLASFGSSATVVFAAVLALAGGALFVSRTSRPRALGLAALPALALGLALSLSGSSSLGVPRLEWRIPYAPGKEFARYEEAAEEAMTRIPSATAEVQVTPDHTWPPITGGNFGANDRRRIAARMVGQDGTAPTMLFRNAADIDAFPFLDDSSTGVGYLARDALGAPPARALIIGVGGGVDVMVALAHGAEHVTAVEINSAMIDMVELHFDDYLGGLFTPGAHSRSHRIELVHGEGRSFARSTDALYDVIQLSGVDSFTALSTGAYTLSEGYLYTVEAVQDFYDRLADGGFIVYSRFIMPEPKPPRETLRLAHIALTALEGLGVDRPSESILVFQGTTWASTMIKKGRFVPAEVRALRAFASTQGFHGIVFDPLAVAGSESTPSSRRDHHARYSIRRAIDQEPPRAAVRDQIEARLFQAYRAQLEGDTEKANRSIAAAVALGGGGDASAARERALVAKLVEAARKGEAHFDRVRDEFKALLGGGAEERRDYVSSYAFDVSPSTDDAPFFFNYYRYAGLLGGGSPAPGRTAANDIYHPEYPVGHLVLVASLAQITLIAALLILLPLRSQRIATTSRALSRRIFAYFAALGAGFMFIEIVLMQKMVLFLGHPTYSITVVLCGLLAFSGAGSWLSGRVERPTAPIFRRLLVAILAAIALQLVAAAWILPELLAWSLPARIAVVITLLLPLGLALGMPFPLGIRVLDTRAPELLPWAWAVNGFLSVFSSIFCIILAMAIGFSAVLILAAALYAVGLIAMGSSAALVGPGEQA